MSWSKGSAVYGETGRIVPTDITFGVELEVSYAPGYYDLQGRTVFGQKTDGSVRGDGLEFVSPILSGDAGYAAVENLLAYAESKGWSADGSCGYHLHIGMRDFDGQAQKAVAMAYALTPELWSRFVPNARKSNSYCRQLAVTPEFIENIGEGGYDKPMYYMACEANRHESHRYVWCNFAAYEQHGTIEIRLHNGTVKPKEVLNWIKAHTHFVSVVRKMTVAQVKAMFAGKSVAGQFRALEQLWKNRDLSEFYRKRAADVSVALHL